MPTPLWRRKWDGYEEGAFPGVFLISLQKQTNWTKGLEEENGSGLSFSIRGNRDPEGPFTEGTR